MNVRDTYLERARALANSGTLTIDLNVVDPITELVLCFGATNGATSNLANHIERNITRLEVVDGSDILFSMSGEDAMGYYAQLGGVSLGDYRSEVPNDGVVASIHIPFGRWVNDQEYALNPVAFKNPQLKIQWNLATINAVGATGFVTNTLTVTVIARVMENSIVPKGFLMGKDVYDFTSLATGDTRVDLPTDYPLRTLFVKVMELGTDPRANITRYKLSIDGDKYIPLDLFAVDLPNYLESTFHTVTMFLQGLCDDTVATHTFVGLSIGGSVVSASGANVAGCNYFWQFDALTYQHNFAGVAVLDNPTWIKDEGYALYGLVPFAFGRQSEPTDWLNLPSYKNALLYLTNGNAGATCAVILQQARSY